MKAITLVAALMFSISLGSVSKPAAAGECDKYWGTWKNINSGSINVFKPNGALRYSRGPKHKSTNHGPYFWICSKSELRLSWKSGMTCKAFVRALDGGAVLPSTKNMTLKWKGACEKWPVSVYQRQQARPANTGNFKRALSAYKRKDYAAALKEWKPLADRGHAGAQYYMGVMYRRGLGIKRSYAEAVKWYRLAARQGYAKAQNALGVRYAKGQGVKRNYAKAVKWYGKAARQGHAKAQNALGVRYERGQGVKKKLQESALLVPQGRQARACQSKNKYREN